MKPDGAAVARDLPPSPCPPIIPPVQTVAKNVRSIVGVEPRVGAVVPRSYAGNDTAHLFGAGIPCCLYGPAAEYDEKTVDRYTPVSQIIDCARVLAATLGEICMQSRGAR